MTNVAITGGSGFVGSHMRFYLNEHKDEFNAVLIEKKDFKDTESLSLKLNSCSILIHLAGMNRGEEQEIYDTNMDLTKKILTACSKMTKKPRIIFLSSTHNKRDTAYGRSKRESETLISEWGKKNKADTVSIVAPNIFGEFGKPYYNSFVSTFSYELSEAKESQVNQSAAVELVYIREICQLIFDLLIAPLARGTYPYKGREVKVADIYNLLKDFRDQYFGGIIPLFRDQFELQLFNTLRSYLYPKHFPVGLTLKTDSRGSFVEIAKERTGGQSSFSTTHPRIVRGNHYHTRKIERFSVISGEASIKMRKLFSDDIIEYKVSGKKPVYVDMPTFYTHSIENTGKDELLTMFWINEIFDPADPDTFPEPVEVEKQHE